MPTKMEFQDVFNQLKAILVPYSTKLTLAMNTKGIFQLEGEYNEKWKKSLFFSSVQVKKNYVSFYLMPVYMYPELLKGISPALKKRMQGKSCFNFKKPEPDLFEELTRLTRSGFERFMAEEYT
ncbi:MAG: hypothetical protein FJZ87_03645 [Chloroflexi bacterium]|nr:hypothetical protein [Chloroflexota bacterium]